MKKLIAENFIEQFEQWFRDVEAGDDDNWSSPKYLSREWHDYLARRQLAFGAWNKALEIALPILDQQERGEGEWIEWGGGDCPVEPMAIVEIKLTQTPKDEGIAHCWDWHHEEGENNIIAYRIIPEKQDK